MQLMKDELEAEGTPINVVVINNPTPTSFKIKLLLLQLEIVIMNIYTIQQKQLFITTITLQVNQVQDRLNTNNYKLQEEEETIIKIHHQTIIIIVIPFHGLVTIVFGDYLKSSIPTDF